MRNSILVRNTSYYTSSLEERGSLKSISCLTPLQVEGEIFNGKETIIKNEYPYKILIDASSAIVTNKIKDDGMEPCEGSLFFIKDRNDKFILDYPIFTAEVDEKNEYSTFVFQKIPVYDEVNAKIINVVDKTEVLYNDFTSYGHELKTNVKDVFFNEELNSREVLKVVNNYVPTKNDLEVKSIFKNVIKRKELDCNIRDEFSIVIKTPKHEDGYETMPIIEIDVSNKINSSVSDGANSGGDLKGLSFIIQQLSFFEFKLDFEKKEVKEVFNLPTGLFFDINKQRIVGTPVLSGRYTISLIFNDESTLNGTIEVPKLNREL